ncbi:hypothetical protein [Terribacillus saccharophilus]|uniref:hypothetical protein n=1 Tax=Terribacillus saccharophilus TaxID=361277 RepID=UPI0014766613|nr:hypothetical protein [Terribacillus goriensis]
MEHDKLDQILSQLSEQEQKIFAKILRAEKEVLHKKSLQGTTIKKDIVAYIKEGVK